MIEAQATEDFEVLTDLDLIGGVDGERRRFRGCQSRGRGKNTAICRIGVWATEIHTLGAGDHRAIMIAGFAAEFGAGRHRV